MNKFIGGTVFLAGLFLAAWRANRCPVSDDGQHDFTNERGPVGWRLACVDCGYRTKGIDAFARKVS